MVIDENIVNRLVESVRSDDVDWDHFNAILDEIDDINAIDEDSIYNTYLSAFMWHHALYQKGDKYRKIIECFVDHGYDMSSYAVSTLFNLPWTSYDKNVLDVARDIFNNYVTPEMLTDDDWNTILDAYDTKFNGAWCIDEDYEWANVMGALIELVYSAKIGRDVNKVFSYHECINKTLTCVCAPNNNAVYTDGENCKFEKEIVFLFDELPLSVFEPVEFVVNGNEFSDNKYDEILGCFDNVIGAKLVNIAYFDSSSCTMLFDNGYHINFSATGNFEICKQPDLKLDEVLYDEYRDCFYKNVNEAISSVDTKHGVCWFDTEYGCALLYTADGKSLDYVTCSDIFKRRFPKFPELIIDSIDVYALDDEITALCVQSGNEYLLVNPFIYHKQIVFTKISCEDKCELDEKYKSLF